eukprot:CAMPEP_0172756802 /NCGR_PEP_ID=MMETSP1074-20121228/162484_1 /TAXON_ID=2916 /ORGANISM="Ceratium fusus, Strain PA161109" /LENGTH=214 /DNA_ID=CAMNT_0013590111 /DNA_START=62 /DNA_END=706 /DNA_ORIENTATION=-
MGGNGATTQLSPAELARLLGNTFAEEELNTTEEECPSTEPVIQETTESMTGQEVLEAMEAAESQLAMSAIWHAGPEALNYADDLQRNALHLAAAEGHTGACNALLSRLDFAGVNAVTNVGSNALHLAAGNGSIEICRLLLASPRFTLGVNAKNQCGLTALDFAVEFGDGAARYVLEAGGAVRGTNGLRNRRRTVVKGPEAVPIDEDTNDMAALD